MKTNNQLYSCFLLPCIIFSFFFIESVNQDKKEYQYNTGNECNQAIPYPIDPFTCNDMTQPVLACACSDVAFSFSPVPNQQERCCFDLSFVNNGQNCFNKIVLNINITQFSGVVPNAGYIFTQTAPNTVEVTFSTGNFPVGLNNAGRVCLTSTNQFFALFISYTYFDNGAVHTCNVVLEQKCPDPEPMKCDSLNPFFDLLHANPPQCCFNYFDDIITPNCFNSINISLSSGFFSNVQTNTNQNFNSTHSSGNINYTYSTGLFPGGQINPGSFCITGQTNPFTFTIKYYYMVGEVRDSCVKNIVFTCSTSSTNDTLCTGDLCGPNNTSWTQIVPSSQFIIYDMAVYHGKLYFAGAFTAIGPLTNANSIACWDGLNWSLLGTGPSNGVTGIVYDLAVHNNKLFIGGSFSSAGGNPCHNIVAWEDISSTFTTLGSFPNDGVSGGLSPSVKALYSFGLDLYVGGRFSLVEGTIPSGNMHIWNDFSTLWSGSNFNGGLSGGVVSVISQYNGSIVAGGSFLSPVMGIGSWNGSFWSSFGSGLVVGLTPNDGVTALENFNGKLCAGGVFSSANIPNTRNLAAWDGNQWSDIDLGTFSGTEITDLLVYNNELFYSGTPNLSLGNPTFTNSVGRLFNNAWKSTNHSTHLVYCLETYSPNGSMASCDIYAAGELVADRLECASSVVDVDISKLRIFPNPTTNYIRFKSSFEPAYCEVIDLLGNHSNVRCSFIFNDIYELKTEKLLQGYFMLRVYGKEKHLISSGYFIKMDH